MNSTARERILGGKPSPQNDNPPPLAVADLQSDSEEDFSVYGSDRTKRQKNMLSFCLASGTDIHLPYNQIRKVKSHEGALMQVFTTSSIITIEGKRLNLIAQRIKHGSLSYINEGGKNNPPHTPDGVCVYSIVEVDFTDN